MKNTIVKYHLLIVGIVLALPSHAMTTWAPGSGDTHETSFPVDSHTGTQSQETQQVTQEENQMPPSQPEERNGEESSNAQ